MLIRAHSRLTCIWELKYLDTMKKKSFISMFAFLLGFGVTTTSCEDMLTPDMDRYAEGFTGKDTVNFYLGILSNVQDVIENNIVLGEVRGDLISTTDFVSDSVSKIANFEKVLDADNKLLNRAGYYKVINQCNFYLAKVDTLAMKNNIFYMRKEFAQVQMMRAWTYMQLVQNYGSVPFITEPVDNAGTGWEKNPPQGFVDADNLLDKLFKNGLGQAYEYERTLGYPNYGTFNTGSVTIPHQQTLFPGDLVLGDLYLLRGASKFDYEKAAAHYYKYLEENKLSVKGSWKASYSESMKGDKEYYIAHGDTWAFNATSLDRGNGAISLIPSAANSSLGKTLTRVQQLYGFDPKSSNQTSVGGENESVVSGNIAITANYKNRQLAPSLAYDKLCKVQVVSTPEMSDGRQIDVEYPNDLGDCRIDGSYKYVQTLGGRLPFVQKFGVRGGNTEHNLGAFKFRYGLPVYRVSQVYLRYAEAVNRAGYPRHAFAVLRNGLNDVNVPELRYDSVYYDDVNKIKYLNIPYVGALDVENGNLCIDKYELYKAKDALVDGISYLDFEEFPGKNCGIHELGCGSFTDMDSLFTYDLRVLGLGWDDLKELPEGYVKDDLKGRMELEALRSGASYMSNHKVALAEVAEEGNLDEIDADSLAELRKDYVEFSVADSIDSPLVPEQFRIPAAPADLQAQINAVETFIADEMALETAFEGWRYYDLYRIARHKNNDSANYGTEWFAWLVSRRNLDLKPYENPSEKGDLYQTLSDMNKWYLQSPKY